MALHAYLEGDSPVAIAHRGGALEAAENSREAFEHATSLGYRYLETDAQLTSDGVVVAFHDPELDRTSSLAGPIIEREWSELAEVELEGGGSLIKMADLLTDFPDALINIDAKSDEVTEPLLDVLDREQAYHRVCLGSFSDERLRKIRSHAGDSVCTSAGPRDSARVVMAGFGLPLQCPPVNALQLPPSYKGLPLITKRLIDYAHDQGLKVHAWTIDDEAEMNRLLDLGVDGIMTDRPTTLKSVFEQRGFPL